MPSLTDKLAEVFAGKDEQVNAFLIARQQINAGQLDWTNFFRNPASKVNMVPHKTFDTPGWDEKV